MINDNYSAITTSLARKRRTISGQVRKAITSSGISRYRISLETGIDKAALSRFMAGKVGLTLNSVDKLAEYLDLEIVQRRKQR